MSDPLPEVWSTRDLPVLTEVVRLIDSGAPFAEWARVADTLDMPADDVKASFLALQRRGLVRLDGVTLGDRAGFVMDVSGDAYFLTGLHPDGDDAISRLIDALRQAAAQVDDPDEKTRLRRLADNAGSVSRDVLAAVLATVITGGLTN